MHLPEKTFRTVVASTPLVSIDLIVRDRAGRVLLGRRLNEPARGSWFVPGGRIFKNELRKDALARICEAELGFVPGANTIGFLGVYEHFYDTNAFGADGTTTHYVVLAYSLDSLEDPSRLRADSQHAALEFFDVAALLGHPQVHPYTKDYFSGSA